MTSNDREYYRRRAAEESAAAQSTSCDLAREVHLDLADRYSAKLRLIDLLDGDSTFSEPKHGSASRRRIAFG